MLELPILKKYHEHPFLRVNTRESGEVEQEPNKNTEDGRYKSITSKLKTRKEQRKALAEEKKKRTKTEANSKGTGHFEMQAAAANRQIATVED